LKHIYPDLLKAYKLKYYFVSNFVPSIAKNLYDKYFLPELKNKAVLDLCSGFGGRFLGFWASKSCIEYVGIDPNPLLVDCYKNLCQWLELNFPDITKFKKFNFIQDCAECMDYTSLSYEKHFDIVFTSPPYFDLEIYGKEETQSCIKYPDFIRWKKEFLFEALYKSTFAVKNNGIIAINLKNITKRNGQCLELCESMILFMKSIEWHLNEIITMPVTKRPGKSKSSDENIYVFKKY
jgi:tRNA1(Val) A37 N6-methylase TrmN6